MPIHYYFQHITRLFILSEQLKEINSKTFRNIEEYGSHASLLPELQKKYGRLEMLPPDKLPSFLSSLKDPSCFPDFFERNLLLTRESLKESVTEDVHIIQTIQTMEEMEKVLNSMAKSLREHYKLYDADFSHNLADHRKFTELIIDRIQGNAAYPKVHAAAVVSMAKEILRLFQLKDQQEAYLETLMKRTCPNITSLTGVLLGAKLIKLAGSLKKLAGFPASTIQVLGAERAMFRHVRNKKNLPPKYGLLHEHPLLTQAEKREHGKIARHLAGKISIAAKVDYFKGAFIGEKLKRELDVKK